MLEEENRQKSKVPKLNKKSMQILQQKQERLELERLNNDKEALVEHQQQFPLTTRAKQPIEKQKSFDARRKTNATYNSKGRPKSQQKKDEPPNFQPKINRNTTKMLQERKHRLEQKK